MAKTDIWMPIYINDYIGDTMELDENGHGIYLMLMFHYWKKGPLTKDTTKLMRIARTQNEDLLKEILRDFFIDSGDSYIHNRIEEEKYKANSRRDSASKNGKKGGRPPKENNPQETNGFNEGSQNNNPQESSSPSPSPSPSPSQLKVPTEKKHKYGEHKNVLLSDTEYKKLSDDWGDTERDRMIQELSVGIAMKGYKYKSHNLALRKWRENESTKKPDQYNITKGVRRDGF